MLFFNELERIDRQYRREQEWTKASVYRQEYYRAKKKGFFIINDRKLPELTGLGKKQIQLFEPEKLEGALLLVTFDIEEKLRAKRDEFRTLLRMLKFKLAQKSVWVSQYDSRDILHSEISRLGLGESVEIYEARSISKS